MAEDSKREQIMVNLTSKLLDLQWPKAARRGRSSFDKLKTIAQTQFPFISVTGGLPSGQPAKIDKQAAFARYTKFISTLRIEVIVYDFIYDDSIYDSVISSRADDIWRQVYEDPSFGNLCLSCVIEPEMVVGVWDPYLAFKIFVVVTYPHGTGGL